MILRTLTVHRTSALMSNANTYINNALSCGGQLEKRRWPQDPIDIADDSSSISTISSDESCGSGGAIDLEDSPSVKDEEDKSDSSSEQSDDEGEGQIIEDIFPVPPVLLLLTSLI